MLTEKLLGLALTGSLVVPTTGAIETVSTSTASIPVIPPSGQDTSDPILQVRDEKTSITTGLMDHAADRAAVVNTANAAAMAQATALASQATLARERAALAIVASQKARAATAAAIAATQAARVAAATAPVPRSSPISIQPVLDVKLASAPHAIYSGARVFNYAKTFLGVPYVFGGASRWGIDCSGLVMLAFRHFGIHLPHSAMGQGRMGVRIPTSQARLGDLVIIPGQHVGLWAGPGMFLEAAHTGTLVRIHHIWASYYIVRIIR